jgi:hypothetical protein
MEGNAPNAAKPDQVPAFPLCRIQYEVAKDFRNDCFGVSLLMGRAPLAGQRYYSCITNRTHK